MQDVASPNAQYEWLLRLSIHEIGKPPASAPEVHLHQTGFV